MSNTYVFLKHHNESRNDDFIHRSEDVFGPFGYSAWFKLLEVLHKHGNGDFLNMSRSRLCSELRCRWTRLELYLNYSSTAGKLQFTCSSGIVQLEIKKFREKQKKMGSKSASKVLQKSTEIEIEKEKEYTPPLPPLSMGGGESFFKTQNGSLEGSALDQFNSFWTAYPKKIAKRGAMKAWASAIKRYSPNGKTFLEVVLEALVEHKKTEDWQKEDGKYIPLPATWLNQDRWEDELKTEGITENDNRYS